MTTSTALQKKEIKLPAWCKCMAWDWEDYEEVPPACNSFKDDGRGYCLNCLHGEDCHKLPTEEDFLITENEHLKAALMRNEARLTKIRRLSMRY